MKSNRVSKYLICVLCIVLKENNFRIRREKMEHRVPILFSSCVFSVDNLCVCACIYFLKGT